MVNKLFIIAVLVFGFSSAQVSDEEEKLVLEMCKTYKANSDLEGEEREMKMLTIHLEPYLKTLPVNTIDSVAHSIYIRFQRICPEYKQHLMDIGFANDKNAGMVIVAEKPNATISKEELKEFKTKELFTYFDANGIMTWLEIKNGIWTEKFFDNTYSKTKFSWISDNQFQLEFIESDNELKKAMSRKGDIYRYEILSKEDEYYWIIAIVDEGLLMTKFKLFYQK